MNGTFAGLPQDGTFSVDFGNTAYEFEISYDGKVLSPSDVTFDGGNDVVLGLIGTSPAPEPTPILLLGIGLVGVSIARRKLRSR